MVVYNFILCLYGEFDKELGEVITNWLLPELGTTKHITLGVPVQCKIAP